MSMAGPASDVLNDPLVLVRIDADIGQSLPQVRVSNRDVYVSGPLSLNLCSGKDRSVTPWHARENSTFPIVYYHSPLETPARDPGIIDCVPGVAVTEVVLHGP